MPSMCKTCGWEDLLEQISDLRDDPENRFSFADETLEGIYDWVQEHEHCTEKQQTAVSNIERSVER